MPFLIFLYQLCLFSETDLEIQEELRVEYVLVDLIVLDKKNRPMTDLSAGDFVVKDDGRKVDIESFQILDYRDLPNDSSSLPAPSVSGIPIERPRQQYIFCLDQEAISFTELRKSFSQLRAAIEKTQLPQNADYMLFSLTSGTITDGFVSNLDHFLTELSLFEDRLYDRHQRMLEAQNFGNEDDTLLGIGKAQDPMESLRENCLKGLQGVSDLSDRLAILRQCIADAIQFKVEAAEQALLTKFGLLEALAYRFTEVDGLKTIFFISPGFSLTPGGVITERYRHGQTKLFAARTHSNPMNVSPIENMLIGNPKSFHEEFKRVVHACTRNRVVFHTLNIFASARETSAVFVGRAGRINERNDAAHFLKEQFRENSKGLEQLSTLSGGMFSRGASLVQAISDWIPRTRYIYLLGYTSPESQRGEYRKIRIKCKRRGARLSYRRGYYPAR